MSSLNGHVLTNYTEMVLQFRITGSFEDFLYKKSETGCS